MRGADLGLLLLAVVLVPFLVAAVALIVDVGGGYSTAADLALTELRTDDVGRHEVLIGPYSRDGWNHPGPAVFYVLAVPYRLVGGRGIGLTLGALLVNAGSLVAIAAVARRRGGLPLLLATLLGFAVLLHAFGPEFVRNPWNPYVVVLPFALVVFLTWEMTCRQAWALPVAAGVASFCAQTHIGYAPLAVPLFVGGALVLVVRTLRRGPEERRSLGRAGVWALIVLVVLWLPPFVQQVQAGRGNLREVLRYFEEGGEGHTVVQGARAVLSQLVLTPEWVTGDREVVRFTGEPAFLFSHAVPVLVLPVVLVVLLLVRRRHGDPLQLAGVLAGAMLLGAASVVRTTGPAYDYRLRWNSLLAMVAIVLVVWAGWELLPAQVRQRWSRRAAVAAVSVLVVATAASTVNAATAGVPYAHESAVVRALNEPLPASLPGGDGVIVVRGADGAGVTYVPSLVRHFEDIGEPVRVTADLSDRYGEHRALRPGERVRANLLVAGDRFDEVREQSDLRLVSYWGTTAVEERARRVARHEELMGAFRAGRISGDELFREVRRLDLGTAVGVFLEPDR